MHSLLAKESIRLLGQYRLTIINSVLTEVSLPGDVFRGDTDSAFLRSHLFVRKLIKPARHCMSSASGKNGNRFLINA